MRSYHYEDVMHSIYGVSYAVDRSAGTNTMEAWPVGKLRNKKECLEIGLMFELACKLITSALTNLSQF